ncbi:MAG: glycosyltransferase [Planctomycetaceae bacterium]|nr:glycosyltransferase [Planctomycetaceae bacterium]
MFFIIYFFILGFGMNRKRILFVIPTLDRSGAEKQLVLLASNLSRLEFEVEVAVLTRGGPLVSDLESSGIRYHLINKRFKIDPFAQMRLNRVVREFQPDLVHTWLFAGNSYGRQAAVSCGVKHIVAGERCVDLWKGAYHFFIDKYFLRYTDCVVTNSEGVKEFYVKNGFPADKFVVIPNAVIPAKSDASQIGQADRIEFLKAIGVFDSKPCGDYVEVICPQYDYERENYAIISNELKSRQIPFIIGIVARLWEQKRIVDALWLFESMRFLNLHFHAVIVGDGPERDKLLRFRDSWRLSDCVHFLGHRNNVAQIMPHFDILINMSEYEGQSNSILEAMSLGIPVIATDIPGNRELVVDGETGVLVPDSGNDFRKRRREFVKAILNLLENDTQRTQMGIAAKKQAAEQFSLEKMINKHAELYKKIIK